MTVSMAKARSCGEPNQVKLGRYIAGSHERSLPDEVINAARMCLADWLAVAIGAREEEAGRVVRETIRAWRGEAKASVLFGEPTCAPFAALANGTLAHCLDFDDTHIGATVHTSAPVWATVMALGESLGADDVAMLRAFVTGFEVCSRVGGGLGQALTACGWHGTGVFGRLGTAAAGASLLRLDCVHAQHALAAAATQAGGLTASFGTMAKPLHAGKAAMDGVMSAQLAMLGFEAQPGVLEPGGGFDKALFQDTAVALQAVETDGFEILNNSFKPYAACHLTHPAVDAARAFELSPERIRRVRAHVSPLALQVTGTSRDLSGAAPRSPLAAKFDLGFCIALALHDKAVSAQDFAAPWQPDEQICATAAKIEAAADPALGYTAARLEAQTHDGVTYTQVVEVAKGHPGNPMSWDDMWAKFNALVAPQLGSQTERLFDQARRFASGATQGELLASLARIS